MKYEVKLKNDLTLNFESEDFDSNEYVNMMNNKNVFFLNINGIIVNKKNIDLIYQVK